MKRLIVICILAALLILCTACDDGQNTIRHDDTGWGIQEWVSPDGAHYWFRTGMYYFMLTPRYGSDGRVVVSDPPSAD